MNQHLCSMPGTDALILCNGRIKKKTEIGGMKGTQMLSFCLTIIENLPWRRSESPTRFH
jgi:hypothetical protein